MMPDRRLSFRTLTASAVGVALLAAGLFAFPSVWTSTASIAAGVIQAIAPTGSAARSAATGSAATGSAAGTADSDDQTAPHPPKGDDNLAPTGTVYVWNQTGTASFGTASNWTPSRTAPATNDTLTFNNGATTTVTNVPIQTIGQLLVSGNTTVNLQAGSAVTLTIAGDTGTDLSVASGSSLNTSGSSAVTVLVATAATGSIYGNMTCSGAQHRLNAADPSAVSFNPGAIFTQETDCLGNVFTTTPGANVIVFASGSTFVQKGGANPFGLTAPNSKVVFQTGSLFSLRQNSAPAMSNRTYSNFEFNVVGGSQSPTGSAALNIDDLTVTAGTLNLNLTGTVNINGNISVATGSSLAFSPSLPTGGLSLKGNIAVAGTLDFAPGGSPTYSLNGTSQQTISGAGSITFNGLQIINVSNPAGVSLQRNLDIAGSPLSIIGNGRLNFGTNFISGATSSITTSATSTLGIGSPDGIATGTSSGNIRVGTRSFAAGTTFIYNGSSNQVTGNGLPASVTNLTIANTGSAGSNMVSGISTQGVSGLLRVQSGIASIATGASTSFGNVQIDSGATLSASGAVRVTGDWSNNGGTFQANSGQVTLLPNANRTISGSSTFYGLVSSNALSSQIIFAAGGTTTVTNNLTLQASDGGNVLTLRSSAPASQWNLNLVSGATQSVSQVDVRDSNASGGQLISSPGSTNSGNNTNWSFGDSPEVDLSAMSIAFGNQGVGTTSGIRSVTISNAGTADLNLGLVTKTGTFASDFTIVADPSNAVIAPGGSAKLRVTYSPSSNLSGLAQVQIPTNDSDEPTVTVNLSGAATSPVTPAAVKSMWVWGGSPNPVTENAGRTTLIQRSIMNNVTDLYVSVYQSTPNGQGRLMYDSAAIADLISRAHNEGKKVWAVYGDPAFQDQPCSAGQFLYTRMQELLAYNLERAEGQRFDGVMLDVEPGASFNLTNYANMHNCVRTIVAGNLRIGTVINAFWSDPVEYPFGGETKPAYQHIIDLPIDQVVVMGYRDNAGSTGGNGIIGLDEDEIAYASSVGRAGFVLAGLETKDLGVPAEENVTFFEEGLSVLESESAVVASHFASSTGFGGFSIHAYEDEYLSGAANWPSLPLVPEITVGGNGQTILNGDLLASGSDNTHFGPVGAGSISHTFSILNQSPSNQLDLTGSPLVEIIGANPGDFTVTSLPSASIAAFGSTSFEITFNPLAEGSRFATVRIASNDPDENPYQFAIEGFGDPSPDIQVTGNSVVIVSGDTTPSATDHTDFGSTTVGQTISRTFTVSNNGSSVLNASDLTLGGNAAFSVTEPLAAIITAGGSDSFTITYAASSGVSNETVSINSNDSDESPYTFSITGAGNNPPVCSPAITMNGTVGTSSYIINALANCSTAPDTGETLSIQSISSVTSGAIANIVGTNIVLAPNNPNIPATYVVAYIVADSSGGTTATAATINVMASPPVVELGQSEYVEDESQSMAVTVTRSGDIGAQSTVDYSITPGSATGGTDCLGSADFVTVSGTLTFVANESSKPLPAIVLCGDTIADADEAFTISLSDPTSAQLGAIASATGTIRDTASQFRLATAVDPAVIYPAAINVTGGPTNVGAVKVTLYDVVYAGDASDIDVLLVGPAGQHIVLMADAGLGTSLSTPATITFSDQAATVLPASDPISSGTFEPTTYGAAESDFAAPAPFGPYNEPGSALGGTPFSMANVFGGTNGNGQWQLYVRLDAGAGFQRMGGSPLSISGGWGLQLLAPTAASAFISGRVLNANGVPIRGAMITVQGMDGLSRAVTTNVFGYYRIEGLRAGEAFVVAVSARRYRFAVPTQFVNLGDNIEGLDFRASP